MTDPDSKNVDPDDLAVCREIAGRANANLLHASRLLPRFRQEFFLSCYAAMRLIDDAVDDEFLCLPPAARDGARPEILHEIAEWRAQCLRETGEGPLPASVLRCLQRTAGQSDLGNEPWTALAKAMERDARELPMESWADFIDYADGATVAPATIFIYLLAAERDGTGYRYPLSQPAKEYAEDLGIFCYLVHILRDLSKDAERSERLLTIPATLLREVGLQRSEVADAVTAGDPRIVKLAELLREKARPYAARGSAALKELGRKLGKRETLALNGLIGIYERLFETFSEDYFQAMKEAPEMERELRRELLAGSTAE